MWVAIIKHELKQRLVMPSDWLYPLVFFLMVLVLFPITFGTQPSLLTQLAVPAVWIAMLFSVLLGANQLFSLDIEHGQIEQLMVARVSLTLWVMLRLCVFWLMSCGLLMLVSMSAMLWFGLSWHVMQVLLLALLIGSPLMVLFAAFAAALAAHSGSASILVPLIALPLQLPVMIFCVGMVERYFLGLQILPTVALLLAFLVLSMMIIPWAIAMILRLSV